MPIASSSAKRCDRTNSARPKVVPSTTIATLLTPRRCNICSAIAHSRLWVGADGNQGVVAVETHPFRGDKMGKGQCAICLDHSQLLQNFEQLTLATVGLQKFTRLALAVHPHGAVLRQ